MIKKILALLLIVMMILSLAACDLFDKDNDDDEDETSSSQGTNQSDNIVYGNSWKASDGSLLIIEDNGDFKWYKDADDLTDNYFVGKCRIYNGNEAIRYVFEDLKEYGVTEEEQDRTIKAKDDRSLDNYYCMVLESNECIMGGENTLDETKTTPYYGFYNENKEMFDYVNMNTANHSYFTLVSD